MKYLMFLLRVLFVLAVVAFAASYYFLNQLTGLKEISAESFSDPKQTLINDPYFIKMKRGETNFTITPKADYKITGVVVAKRDYALTGGDFDAAVPYDVCIVWGRNVEDNLYMSSKLKFTQSQRFCYYSYSENIGFEKKQTSNNHLIIKDNNIQQQYDQVNIGDEVEISGRLVNLTGSVRRNDEDRSTDWKSSMSRDDDGEGACELIYVDSIRVVNSAQADIALINRYSSYAALGLLAIFVLKVVLYVLFTKPPKKSPSQLSY